MRALHRSELRKLTPEALAEMAFDILAILTEWESLDLIQEVQAERRDAMMGEEGGTQQLVVVTPASPNATDAGTRP